MTPSSTVRPARTGGCLRALALTAILTSPLAAPAAGLNDTGQTHCYDGTGTAISCDTAADDGRYGRDAAATAGVLTKTGGGDAGFDFTKIANNGTAVAAGTSLGSGATDWACTQDNVTGFMWEVKVPGDNTVFRSQFEEFTWFNSNGSTNGGQPGHPNLGTCSSAGPNGANQCDTEKYVANVNAINGGAGLCGHNDWRLPTIGELNTIIHFARWPAATAIDETYFTDLVSFIWSASYDGPPDVFPPYWSYAKTIFPFNGIIWSNFKGNPASVLLVRGGTPATSGICTADVPNTSTFEDTPTADFTIHGDGTVTHGKTGLMWKQCAEGLSGPGCATGSAAGLTWTDALGTAVTANNSNGGAGFANHNDWRLPNVKELVSILETCGSPGTINSTVFPATPGEYGHWSATPYVSVPERAWVVGFGYAEAISKPKTDVNHVRLVRGGQPADAFDIEPYIPAPFSFTDQTGVSLSSVITSAPEQITGLGATANWTVSGSGQACVSSTNSCSCDVAAYATSGTVQNNQYLCAQHTSSGSFSTAVDTTVTISGVSDTFTSTTLAADTTPNAFSFIPVTNADRSTVYVSNTITVAGINTVSPISIVGGEYRINSINDADFTSDPGTVVNGDVVDVRQTSSGSSKTLTTAILTIGGVSGDFDVTTRGGAFVPVPVPVPRLPLPNGPHSYPEGGACFGLGSASASVSPGDARPLGGVETFGDFYLGLLLPPLAGVVDLYLVIERPDGMMMTLNAAHQWAAYPPASPLLEKTMGPLAMNGYFNNLFKTALASIPPGPYKAYLVMVPAGADPSSFDPMTSSYHQWCFEKTF